MRYSEKEEILHAVSHGRKFIRITPPRRISLLSVVLCMGAAVGVMIAPYVVSEGMTGLSQLGEPMAYIVAAGFAVLHIGHHLPLTWLCRYLGTGYGGDGDYLEHNYCVWRSGWPTFTIVYSMRPLTFSDRLLRTLLSNLWFLLPVVAGGAIAYVSLFKAITVEEQPQPERKVVHHTIIHVKKDGSRRVTNVRSVMQGEKIVESAMYDGLDIKEEQASQVIDNMQAGEAIDLGLSVKWCSSNVGATGVADYGNYYVWGALSPCDMNTAPSSMKKDVNLSKIKPVDVGGRLCIAGSKYDVAHVALGGKWRMPTMDEQQELIKECKWERDVYDGVKGVRATASNGKSIFFPAAGYVYAGNARNVGSHCYYWAGETLEGFEADAAQLYFTNQEYGGPRQDFRDRTVGLPIRPVLSR